MEDEKEFPDGTWVALILPGGKILPGGIRAVGVVVLDECGCGNDRRIHYVDQFGEKGWIRIPDVLDIAELIINWEASIH